MIKVTVANLIETNRDELLRFLFNRVKCQETALDIIQDCFVRLVGYMKCNTVKNPRALLFRIAANLATDYLRRRTRLNNSETNVSKYLDLKDSAPPLDEIVSGMERMDRLMLALAELPPNRREVFILRNIKQCSYAEITEQTGLCYNTIFKYINEALLHCQKRIED